MREYKRLTNNNSDEYDTRVDFCTGCYSYKYGFCDNPDGECSNFTRFCEMYNRLAELEDKIEAGTLVELPVKVGDIVYLAGAPQNSNRMEAEIEAIRFMDNCIVYEWAQYDRSYELIECWDEGDFDISDIGKTIFLTREAAERHLAELKGEER